MRLVEIGRADGRDSEAGRRTCSLDDVTEKVMAGHGRSWKAMDGVRAASTMSRSRLTTAAETSSSWTWAEACRQRAHSFCVAAFFVASAAAILSDFARALTALCAAARSAITIAALRAFSRSAACFSFSVWKAACAAERSAVILSATCFAAAVSRDELESRGEVRADVDRTDVDVDVDVDDALAGAGAGAAARAVAEDAAAAAGGASSFWFCLEWRAPAAGPMKLLLFFLTSA